MSQSPPTLSVRFFCTDAGNEPVREWLADLAREDRKSVGTDIKTVQIGWPIGMPVVRKMGNDLWEVRTHLKDTIARVLFTVEGSTMVLLHGFIKKSDKTPASDLETAKKRKAALKRKR
jgi:phage-related protein